MGNNANQGNQNESDSAIQQEEVAGKKPCWSTVILVIGGIFLVLFIVGLIKPKSCIANLRGMFFGGVYISSFCVVISIVQLIFAHIPNKKITYDYNFKYNLELAIYKEIGKIEKYPNYMKWKEHIKEVCPKQEACCNFCRFMNRRLRNAKASCEFLTAVFVPFQVGLIPIFFTFKKEDLHICCASFVEGGISVFILALYVIAMILMVFLFLKFYLDLKDEIYFAEDVIEIVGINNNCDINGKKIK